MYGILWVLMIGAVSWWIGNISGQDGYAQMLEGQAGWCNMLFGIVGASVGSSLFVFRSRQVGGNKDEIKSKRIAGAIKGRAGKLIDNPNLEAEGELSA